MELKVGMKAIIVNSQHHAEYNFQKCEIESIENGKRVWVLLNLDNHTVRFCVAQNELIPLVYEKPEDLKKYGTTVEDIAELFTEYKGYYDCMCKICEGLGSDLAEKDEKHKQEIKEKNCKIAEMQAHIDCLKAELEEVQTAKQELPFAPIDAAKMLIDATYPYTNLLGRECEREVYGKEELRQIAEHLLVYCNANSEE